MQSKSWWVAMAMTLSAGAMAAESPKAVDVSPPNRTSSIQIDIPAQSLADSIQAIARQTNTNILVDPGLVAGLRAPAIKQQTSLDDALSRLLEGTGLTSKFVDEKTIVVAAVPSTTHVSDVRPLRLVHTQTSSGLQPRPSTVREGRGEKAEEQHEDSEEWSSLDKTELEEVVVTGSHIGAAAKFSPVLSFDRDYFDRAGITSAGQLLASLPQNFGGGVSADNVGVGSGAGPGAATVNLRGLESGGTLTLLNGRRLAPSSFSGGDIDISSIPVSAIERVEVLTDGASAIYGSDAVAGVVNFILRKDYDGAETRLLLGTITQGDGDEVQLAHTFGRSGDAGDFLLSYEYAENDGLLANDKSFVGGDGLPDSQILPSTRRHGFFGTGSRRLTDVLDLQGTVYYTDRRSGQLWTTAGGDPGEGQAHVRQGGGSAGLDWSIDENWNSSFSIGLARNLYHNADRNLRRYRLQGAQGVDDSRSGIYTADALLRGDVLSVPGGEIRSVFGYSLRKEMFDALQIFVRGPDDRHIADDVDNDRNVNAVFAEAYVPIVGQANARPGVQELSLSLAGRYEDYSDIGSSFNPKFGVVWSPLAGLSLRSTYGRSFRAPNLERLRDVIDVVTLYDYIDPTLPGAETPALLVVGNSSDLDPEKSESVTVGVDLQPPGLSNLNVGATYYHIRYTGRIDYPRVDFRADNRLSDYSSIPIRNPSLDVLQGYVDRAGLFDNYTQMFPGHSNSELSDVTLLLLYMPLNTVATETSGIDLGMSYQLDTSLGVWTADLNANYIMQFDERTSPQSPVQSVYNRIFLPVDLRARASLSWTRGGLTTSAFVNYTDDYINDQTDNVPTRIDAWTTLDASLQYEFPDNPGASVLSGVVLTFNVLNVLDADPPRAFGSALVGGPGGFAYLYDTTNADPTGRSVSLQLLKRW